MKFDDIKFWIASAIFFGVTYPLKKVVIPTLIIIKEQAYILLAGLLCFVLLYLYDYNLDKIITDFVVKVGANDSWFLQWIITPLVFDSVFTTPLMMCVIVALACSLVNLGMGWVKLFKIAAGIISDGILAILYVYYTLAGNNELSTICSTNKDERRTKIVVYFLVAMLFAAVIVYVIVTGKSGIETTLTSTNILLNVTFPNEMANITKVSLDFIPGTPYDDLLQHVTGVIL